MQLQLAQRAYLLTGNGAALLGYLALQGRSGFQATRSRLAGTLWPDSDEERARHLLSNTLYRLQRQVPELADHLVLSSETVGLMGLAVDAVRFGELAAGGDPAGWQEALALYRGDLLEELDGEWLLNERVLMQEQFLATLGRASQHLAAAGPEHHHEALLLAHRWVQADPLDESAHALVMQLYARLGRPGAARRQYEQLARLLAEELGAAPSAGVTALLAALPQPRAAVAGSMAPFVGRQAERAGLLALLDQLARGSGGLALVEGEPGIGKTTLLREIERAAAWRQLACGWGSGQEGAPRLFGPLVEALQGLGRRPALSAASAEAPPVLRPLVEALLGAENADLPPSHFAAEMSQAAALRYLLQRWVEQGPLLLILDDVQWADPQFWRLWPTLVALCQEAPILLLLAYRDWELRQSEPALAALQESERFLRPLRLTLSGFTTAEVAELVQAQASQAAADVTSLQQLSGGNPLLLQELLQGAPGEVVGLGPLLTGRWQKLAEVDQTALAAAAIFGLEVPFVPWSALLPAPLTGPQLRRLVGSRFLRETDTGYAFQHGLVRLHLYRQIPGPQRERWHRQAAELLRQERSPQAVIAWHFAQGAALPAAVFHYQRAAEGALALRAPHSAAQYAAEAADLAVRAGLTAGELLGLHWLQLQLAHQASPTSERLPQVELLLAEARAQRDEDIELRLLLLKFDLLMGQSRQPEIERVQTAILGLVAAVGNPALALEAWQQLALKHAFTMGDSETGLTMARRGWAQAATLADRPELQAEMRLILAACLLRARQADAALVELEAVRATLTDRPELHHIAADWRYLWGVAAQFTGDWDTAHQLHEETLAQQRLGGGFYGLTTALYNTANSASFQGMHEVALAYATELVTLAERELAADDYQKKLQYRALLAQCYEQAGEHEAAAAALAPLRDWLERQEQGAAVVQAWQIIGRAHLGLGEAEVAYEVLRRAVDLAEGLSGAYASPFLALAQACQQTGRAAEALVALTEAGQRINFDGPSMANHTHYFYLRYLLNGAVADLARAHDCLVEQADRFAHPEKRADYVARITLHRQVRAAYLAMRPAPLRVRLVRQDVPLGRPLVAEDYVTVDWTVDAGPADAALQAAAGEATLRRQRLARLMAEARAQGAAPTYGDLAQVLQVSERTIERDIKQLAAGGHAIHTRRRQVPPT
ncbi:MAG: AAA family ATPase [Anaerolineales bacterium]|nr:AAA family ATPase [Anaerolineales bacterium]